VENKFIENVNIDSLSGIDFEQLIMGLLRNMGLQVTETKKSGDGGVDIIAQSSEFITGGVYIIQCKRYAGNIGEPVIRDLYGVVHHMNASKGVLITNSDFTKQARDFSENKPIELINGFILKKMLSKYELKDLEKDDRVIYVYNKNIRKSFKDVISLFNKLESMNMTDSSMYDSGKLILFTDFMDLSLTQQRDAESLVSIVDLLKLGNNDSSVDAFSLRLKAIRDIVNIFVKKRKAIVKAKIQMDGMDMLKFMETMNYVKLEPDFYLKSESVIRKFKQASLSLFDSLWKQVFSVIKELDKTMSDINGTLVSSDFVPRIDLQLEIPESIMLDYTEAITEVGALGEKVQSLINGYRA
jgi:hypothetical protein